MDFDSIDDYPIETFYFQNGTEVDPYDHRCQKGVPGGSQALHTFQLTWALLCTVQALFLMSKWPKVGWEAIYMPCCEALSYGLLSSGHGYLKLHGEWHYLPWIRYAAWLVTTPVLLNQVQGIMDVKIGSLRLAPVQSLANLLCIIMGVSAHLQEDHGWKWLFYMIGCVMCFVVYWIAWLIFTKTIAAYAATKTETGDKVVFQLKLIMFCFYVGWSAFPVIWMLGSEGFCIIEEHVSAAAHIPGDVLSKNAFGLLMWWTRWFTLGGAWSIEKFNEKREKEQMEEGMTPADKRRAMMKQAEACFNMADACLQQANTCIQNAMENQENEQMELQKAGALAVTARANPFGPSAASALHGHPMEASMLASMDKLSFPLPFDVAKAQTSVGANGNVEHAIRTSMQKLKNKQRELEDMDRSTSDYDDHDVKIKMDSLAKPMTPPDGMRADGDDNYRPPYINDRDRRYRDYDDRDRRDRSRRDDEEYERRRSVSREGSRHDRRDDEDRRL